MHLNAKEDYGRHSLFCGLTLPTVFLCFNLLKDSSTSGSIFFLVVGNNFKLIVKVNSVGTRTLLALLLTAKKVTGTERVL